MSAQERVQTILGRLRPLLDEGFRIAKAKDVALAPEYLHDALQPGYEMVVVNKIVSKQAVIEAIPDWLDRLEKTFIANDMNYDRFIAQLNINKPKSMKVLHLGERFNLALSELQKIIETDRYITSYFPANSHRDLNDLYLPVVYKGGTISQGGATHSFTHPEYIALFNFLWKFRKIVSKDGIVINPGSPKTKYEVQKATKINDQRLKAMAVAVQKVLSKANIGVRLRRPDRIYIEVIQDTRQT